MSTYSDYQVKKSQERGLAPLTGTDAEIDRADSKRSIVLAMIQTDLEGQPAEDLAQLNEIVARLRNQTAASFWLNNHPSFVNTESALNLALTLEA